MRVFLTGATGFIGSAIVTDLLAGGHEILGLARSDAAAEKLRQLGVAAHRGELSDAQSLAEGARACDGVIHTAFIHDFAHYVANAELDRRVLAVMAAAMEGSGKPLIVTSGTGVLPPGRVGVETDSPVTEGMGSIRAMSEEVLSAAERGVRVCVVRLPPTVHGEGDHGFVPALIELARRKGFSAYVGEGANRWPAVHRLDAARLFRLALEKAQPGTRVHGTAEEGIAFRTIAEAIGAGLGVPVRSLSMAEAALHFDWMAQFAATDMPSSSAITRSALGWQPQGPELLAGLQQAGYFEVQPATA